MSRSTRSVLAVVAVLAVAGTAYWAWERFFAHAREVEAIHRACVADVASGKAKARAALPEAGTALGELSAPLGRLMEEVADGVSAAGCGALRESCRLDWDGDLCRRVRQRYG